MRRWVLIRGAFFKRRMKRISELNKFKEDDLTLLEAIRIKVLVELCFYLKKE